LLSIRVLDVPCQAKSNALQFTGPGMGNAHRDQPMADLKPRWWIQLISEEWAVEDQPAGYVAEFAVDCWDCWERATLRSLRLSRSISSWLT